MHNTENILCTTLYNDIIMCMSYSESVSLQFIPFLQQCKLVPQALEGLR